MARFLAQVIGIIISMGLWIGPVSRMWTRRLYANVNQASAWDRPLTLAPDALRKLEFWENCLKKFNGQPKNILKTLWYCIIEPILLYTCPVWISCIDKKWAKSELEV